MNALCKLTLSLVAAGVTSVLWLGGHPLRAYALGESDQTPLDKNVVVCVGRDSVLRIADPGGTCPPGQRSLPLDLGAPGTLGPNDAPSSDDASLPTKKGGTAGDIADLEQRVAALQKKALLEVVDSEGHVIFSVAPQDIAIYNHAQALVCALRGTSGAGLMTLWSADEALEASAGVYGTRSGISISENGRERVDIGRRPTGNYAFRILSLGSASLAGIGESSDGTGMLVVSDDDGNSRASMKLADGRPQVELTDGSGHGLVSLGQSAGGAGLFEIGDSSGDPMVKMVVNDDRYGAVLAGPRAGFPLVPSSGLPGSYILGCAGGDACHP